MITAVLVVFCGGLGALARFAVDGLVQARWLGSYPAGTLVVNLGGSFLLRCRGRRVGAARGRRNAARERRRARFFARNADVPLILLAIGEASIIEQALPTVAQLVEAPVATIERIALLSSGGSGISVPEHDESGLPIWQKLTVHAEEQATCDGRPLHTELVRRMRDAGAAGATTLRAVRGFYGNQEPFADRILSVKRHAPMHTIIIDRPANLRRLWPALEEVTLNAGLVTSELVPAFHHEPAIAAHGSSWGRLARPWGVG